MGKYEVVNIEKIEEFLQDTDILIERLEYFMRITPRTSDWTIMKNTLETYMERRNELQLRQQK